MTAGNASGRPSACRPRSSSRRPAAFAAIAVGALGCVLQAPTALAEDAISPIRLIVPFPEGGSSYYLARIVAQGLQRELHEDVRLEVKEGNFGINALQELRGRPNGRTIVLGSVMTPMIPVFHADKLPLDFAKAVEPVTKIALFPRLFMVDASSRAGSVREFLEGIRSRGGTLVYGTDYLGTIADVDAITLGRLAGLKVSYRATSGALGILTDLVERRIDVTLLNAVTGVQNKGKYKALAIVGPARLDKFPGVPTLAEAGYPNVGVPFWQGLFVVRGTPRGDVMRLHRAAAKAMSSSDARAALQDVMATVVTSASPEEFGDEIDRERAQWERVKDEVLRLPQAR